MSDVFQPPEGDETGDSSTYMANFWLATQHAVVCQLSMVVLTGLSLGLAYGVGSAMAVVLVAPIMMVMWWVPLLMYGIFRRPSGYALGVVGAGALFFLMGLLTCVGFYLV